VWTTVTSNSALLVEAGLQSRSTLCGICCKNAGISVVFPQAPRVSLTNYHLASGPYSSIIRAGTISPFEAPLLIWLENVWFW